MTISKLQETGFILTDGSRVLRALHSREAWQPGASMVARTGS